VDFLLQGRLAQPIANWAKDTGFGSEGKSSVTEVGGKRYSRLPSPYGVRAQGYRVRESPLQGVAKSYGILAGLTGP